jgi:hypothetical protein
VVDDAVVVKKVVDIREVDPETIEAIMRLQKAVDDAQIVKLQRKVIALQRKVIRLTELAAIPFEEIPEDDIEKMDLEKESNQWQKVKSRWGPR